MLDRIKAYLTPPTFEGTTRQTAGSLLYVTLLTLQGLFLVVPLLFAVFVQGRLFTPAVGVGFLLAGVTLIFVGLFRRGYLTLVSWLTVFLLLFATAATLFVFNGMRDPLISMMLFAVVISGLLLANRRDIGLVAFVTILLFIALYLAERQGVISAEPQMLNLNHLFWPVLSTALISALVGFTIRNLNQALARARQSERAAEEAREQLEALNIALEARVAARTRALQLSADVSRRLSTILDRDELIRTVVQQLQQTFNYYHVHIYLFNEAEGRLHLVGGTGEAARTMLEKAHTIELGEGLVGRAASSNLPVLVSDVSQEPDWLPNPLLPETQAEIAVPIARADDVIGVLDVQHNVQDGLTGEDVELIQSVTNQIAVALQNAQLYRQAQQRAEEQQLLNTITERVQQTTSVDQALQVAVRELGWALDGQSAQVNLYPAGEPIASPSGE